MSRRLDRLKPLPELLVPDSRSVDYERFDPDLGAWRRITLEDFYAQIAAISLHAGVPAPVREHFASAHNVLAYSWLYYPFNVTAQFLAYVSIEYALRDRYNADHKVSFRRLVGRAVTEGLVADSGFSHIAPPQERILGSPIPEISTDTSNAYVKRLVDALPGLRNHLAHGSNMLHNSGLGSVRIASEFINQLFPVPT
jgi:hypothetical protein